MTKAIRIHEYGGPENLVWEDVDLPDPAPGEAQVKHSAVGLNYIDVYQRAGLYPVGDLPATLGMEGAGTVVAVGDGVTDVAVGDRVAYEGLPIGSYSEARNIAADRLITLPDSVSEETAAAMMLQGLTAQYLLRRTYNVKAGDKILIHAAAGGVGLIVCQWANYLGATVIGTVGSEEKAALAKANGCHHTINYQKDDFEKSVKEITNGEGVAVVYDSIGKDTFEGSLNCLQPMGMMVSFGNASGPVPPFEPAILAQKGSLFFTRPTLMTYTARTEDLRSAAADLLDVVGKGAVKISINQRYDLKDTAQAHRDLEARKTTGSTILIP